MALCWDCSKAEGVVRVGPLMICPACAEARIRSLEAVAEQRAREWQRERIRAEKLAHMARPAVATTDPQYDPEDALYDHYEARSDAQ